MSCSNSIFITENFYNCFKKADKILSVSIPWDKWHNWGSIMRSPWTTAGPSTSSSLGISSYSFCMTLFVHGDKKDICTMKDLNLVFDPSLCWVANHMKSYISHSLFRHWASLQLRSHSYGYAPCVVPHIASAQVARNMWFHMASYLPRSYMGDDGKQPFIG